MTFKMTGHSGCLIELLEEGGAAFVRKRTQKPDYADRLIAQAKKQKKFMHIKLPVGFDVPDVYRMHGEGAAAYFDMAYVNASDFISFFTYADVGDVDRICMTIQRWLDHCVQECTSKPFPLDNFLSKLHDVKERIVLNPLADNQAIPIFLQTIEKHIEKLSPVSLLSHGMCHGDLTLSNMLIHDPERITLIDLLDNFIETPLQDMVKLRQDTCFFWSLQFYQGDFNRLHIQNIMRNIDAKIDRHCRQYPFYREYYTLFQILNHLRVIPYAKDKNVIEHTINVLRKLLMRPLCT